MFTAGVIAMSWCHSDSSYLLTCAKDKRTICWDTTTTEIVCELPTGTNWNFDVHWYPKIPGVISASSFDGKIGMYNIELIIWNKTLPLKMENLLNYDLYHQASPSSLNDQSAAETPGYSPMSRDSSAYSQTYSESSLLSDPIIDDTNSYYSEPSPCCWLGPIQHLLITLHFPD